MHALAMYTPFLIVVTLSSSAALSGRGAAGLFLKPLRRADPYGATPGPIYFGANYVTRQEWRQLGLIASVSNILIRASVGLVG
jgi:DASS family divalent anion:Na+ symporter